MEFSAEELIASVKPDLRFFKNSGGGITVTGGEPLSQPDFTYELLSGCYALGINTILETSGQGSWEKLKMIAGVCSMVYFDIKIIDPAQHRQWTGLSNERILDNLRNLCKIEDGGRKILARVPCIPGINDSAESIREIALFAASLGVESMQLLPYNIMAGEKYRWIGRDYSLDKIETRNRDYYEELNRLVETAGLTALR
jgi:pyruvate formate lyase activating enzyme